MKLSVKRSEINMIWRAAEGANLVQRNGEEKPAVVCLREYISGKMRHTDIIAA